MNETASSAQPAASVVPSAGEDLSKAINDAVEKRPGEQARTVRLFDDMYRCNWWTSSKGVDWMAVTTGSIARSKFLRATVVGGKLVIVDVGERVTA